jgi:hypothetical protein
MTLIWDPSLHRASVPGDFKSGASASSATRACLERAFTMLKKPPNLMFLSSNAGKLSSWDFAVSVSGLCSVRFLAGCRKSGMMRNAHLP